VITDSVGNIKAESDYYPWGGELQFVANDANHYKFTGKERDSETGFDYFGARYYSNGLGRFISADWSAAPVPVPYADFGDPQSLNLYTYVRNIPTTRFDTDGHDGLPLVSWGGPIIITPQQVSHAVDVVIEVIHTSLNGPSHPLPTLPRPECTCPPPPGQHDNRQNNNSSQQSATKNQSGQGKSAQRAGKRLRRPYIRKNTRNTVEDNAQRTVDGRPIDPNTGKPIDT